MSELSKIILELIAAGYRVQFASSDGFWSVVINVSNDDTSWSRYVCLGLAYVRIDNMLCEELRRMQHQLATPTDAKERG